MEVKPLAWHLAHNENTVNANAPFLYFLSYVALSSVGHSGFSGLLWKDLVDSSCAKTPQSP